MKRIALWSLNFILYLLTLYLFLTIGINDKNKLTLAVSLLSFNLALTTLLAWWDQKKILEIYRRSDFNYWFNVFLQMGLLYFLFGLINYFSFKHPYSIDLSPNRLNSLTAESKNILNKMNKPIHFIFLGRKADINLWHPLLEIYRLEKSAIQIEEVDIDQRPDKGAAYNVTQSGVLIVEYNNKRQKVIDRDELNITNALIKVSRESDPKIYWAFGHGEADHNSKNADGLNFIYELVKNAGVEISDLNLISANHIPFDAKTIIIWGPRNDFHPTEIEMLRGFIKNGGHLLVGLDPDVNKDNLQFLKKLLKDEFGLMFPNAFTYDKKSYVNGSDGAIPLITNYDNKGHELLQNAKGQFFFPLVSPIIDSNGSDKEDNPNISFLLSTNDFPFSWAEKKLSKVSAQKIEFDEKTGIKGPIHVMAVYSKDKRKAVFFGNSTFLLNAYDKFTDNYQLFINSIHWLVDEDRLISFDTPIITRAPIVIKNEDVGFVFYFSVLFVPLILIIVAIVFYFYKKRK